MGQGASVHFSKPETLRALRSRILPPDDELWNDIFEAARDPALLTQLTFKELSSVLTTQPANMAILLYRFTTTLHVLLQEDKMDTKEINQHLLLLTWVIPPILSSDTDLQRLIFFHAGPLDTSELIQGPRKIVHPPPSPDRSERPVELKDIVLRVPGLESKSNQTLAECLVSILTSLLFLPGFTIAEPSDPKEIIWAKGLGCQAAKGASREMLSNRTQVLRTILACMSHPLYQNATDAPLGNEWLEFFVNEKTNLYSWEMFCSLMNVSLTYDPVGWGLPYNYLLSSDDSGETLAEVSLHVLLVLLNRHQTVSSNVFQMYLQALGSESAEEFSFVFTHIAVLLSNPLETKNSYLPASGKAFNSHQEILLLFWTLLAENKSFLTHILNKEDITLVASPILHYMLSNRRNDGANGFVHMSTFCLLLLSGERKFGVQLNKLFVRKYPLDASLPSFKGTFNDFMVLVISKLMMDCSARLIGLHDTLLTVLVNVSPFITSLSMTAAMKLAKMFEMFAAPKNLLSNKNCHRYVQFLLEIFNNLIQYQYAGNAAIVYSVVHHHQTFKNLTNLRIRSKKENSQNSPEESEPTRWVPTNEWLQEWKSQLPLSTTIRLINAVLPDIIQISKESKSNTESAILEYLKIPLVGLLPVPHPILTRRYQENNATNLWFQRYMWSVIVLHNKTVPFFGQSSIQLFKVANATN